LWLAGQGSNLEPPDPKSVPLRAGRSPLVPRCRILAGQRGRRQRCRPWRGTRCNTVRWVCWVRCWVSPAPQRRRYGPWRTCCHLSSVSLRPHHRPPPRVAARRPKSRTGSIPSTPPVQRCRRQRLQRCHPRPAPVGKREGRFARPSRTSWRRPQSLDPLLPQCRIPLRPAIPGRRTPRRWRPFRRWVSVPHGSKVQWRTVPDGDPPVARWRAGSGPARRRISQPTNDIERLASAMPTVRLVTRPHPTSPTSEAEFVAELPGGGSDPRLTISDRRRYRSAFRPGSRSGAPGRRHAAGRSRGRSWRPSSRSRCPLRRRWAHGWR